MQMHAHIGKALTILLLLSGTAPVAAQDSVPEGATWPADMIDPGADHGPADLVLPMPCGAAMAFQKVTVPAEAADPLADRRVRLGRSQASTGYADYLRPAYLRGPFTDADTGTTHYYIARYELTRGQYRALQGDCGPPARADRLAQGGLSWFDAIEAARDYSGWLYGNTPVDMPRADGVAGFLRLPTEAEWEYAARGGARVDASEFAGPTFFGTGDMRNFARHQAPGSSRGRLGPVGALLPNPLGLFDIYGNAEELMFEPFRLNALGRKGGQVGGVVTRGGSVLSTAEQIYSAQRTEYPPFDTASGAALAGETFGLRLVLATHIATSDAHLRAISDRWNALSGTGGARQNTNDPGVLLAEMIAAETDPRRVAALGGLELELRRARDRVQTAQAQSIRSTLLAGAVFVATLNDNAASIDSKAAGIRMLVDLQRAGPQSALFDRQLQSHLDRIAGLRRLQDAYLLSYRAALETLTSDATPQNVDAVYSVLHEELVLAGQSAEPEVGRGSVLASLERFRDDLVRYAEHPDLNGQALVALALDHGPDQ